MITLCGSGRPAPAQSAAPSAVPAGRIGFKVGKEAGEVRLVIELHLAALRLSMPIISLKTFPASPPRHDSFQAFLGLLVSSVSGTGQPDDPV